MTPAALESQLESLVGQGYHGETFTRAVSQPGRKTLVVTFDDAFRSVVELALPIMSRLGLPGSLFVPTDYVGSSKPMAWEGTDRWLGTEHEHELIGMTWQEVRTLRDAGWEIGSHTRSHPHLTRLGDDGLVDELLGSREQCEAALGAPCRSLAYPYGDVDARVVAATREAGYTAAATLPSRLHAPSPLQWPRVGIYHEDGSRRFRLKVSPTVRLVRGSRAWTTIERLRH